MASESVKRTPEAEVVIGRCLAKRRPRELIFGNIFGRICQDFEGFTGLVAARQCNNDDTWRCPYN